MRIVVATRSAWLFRFTCFACLSVCEAETSDLHSVIRDSVDSYLLERYLETFVRCGVCGTANVVPNDELVGIDLPV